MDILLTGATGLIGHSLIRYLSSEHDITAVTRDASMTEQFPVAKFIKQDLSSNLDDSRLPEKVGAVIHLAQSRSFRDFPVTVEDIFSVNVQSTLRLADYARRAGAACFIFASTGGVYRPGENKLKETDPIAPSNFYGNSKYAAEILLSSYSSYFRVVILRFFFVYGPRQRNMLIPNLLGRVLKSESISIEGKPGLNINPIYVDDVVRAFPSILHKPVEGAFNIAGDEVVSMTELVNLMGEMSAKTVNINYQEAKVNGDLAADNTRMKQVLGVSPNFSLRQGLSEMVKSLSSDYLDK